MPSDPHYHRKRPRLWRDKVISKAGGLCEECKRFGRVDKD